VGNGKRSTGSPSYGIILPGNAGMDSFAKPQKCVYKNNIKFLLIVFSLIKILSMKT